MRKLCRSGSAPFVPAKEVRPHSRRKHSFRSVRKGWHSEGVVAFPSASAGAWSGKLPRQREPSEGRRDRAAESFADARGGGCEKNVGEIIIYHRDGRSSLDCCGRSSAKVSRGQRQRSLGRLIDEVDGIHRARSRNETMWFGTLVISVEYSCAIRGRFLV